MTRLTLLTNNYPQSCNIQDVFVITEVTSVDKSNFIQQLKKQKMNSDSSVSIIQVEVSKCTYVCKCNALCDKCR